MTRIVHPDTAWFEGLRLSLGRAIDGYRISIRGPHSAAHVALIQGASLGELIGSPTVQATRPLTQGAADIVVPFSSMASDSVFFAARWEPAITNPHPDTLVWVAPGSFTMGSPPTEVGRDSDEGPTTLVHLPDGFFIDRYETPVREYRELMLGIPNTGLSTRMPAVQVSWEEAVEFAALKTRRDLASGAIPDGYSYRLPTEAEWEFAARAGTTSRYNFGDNIPDRSPNEFVWYLANIQGQLQPSGKKSPNAWGLHDMHGNAAEWCLDHYAGYLGGQDVNPRGPESGEYQVIRGGSVADEIQYCRSAFRQFEWLDSRFSTVGFRLVLAPDRPTQAPLGIDLVPIPAGTFHMGSPASELGRQFDESPTMAVTLSRPFYASRFEITQGQFASLMSTNPSVFRSGQSNRPVENVSWDEATLFCRRLTENERASGSLPAGWVFRLPTEAEWEYMARAGSTERYSFGDDPAGDALSDHAWFLTSGQTYNVATKTPNPWGLFNIHGNVAEWCQDNSDLYPGGPVVDPLGPATSAYRVIRGGGFSDDAVYLRSACRWSAAEPWERFRDVGFRVVLAPSDPSPVPPIQLIQLEPGVFTLGSPPSEPGREDTEDPAHTVEISRAFWIGKYEVTQSEYQLVTGTNPSYDRRFAHQPVEQVSWEEAVEFCRELTRRAAATGSLPVGYEYRLPTEAEWEFAARAGTTTPYSFGIISDSLRLEDHACYLVAPTCGVGSKLPNPWGLHDVHGNVSEWCHDWYGPYSAAPGADPTGPLEGSARIARGGSWNDPAPDCRSAKRFALAPGSRSRALGFRVVLGPMLP